MPPGSWSFKPFIFDQREVTESRHLKIGIKCTKVESYDDNTSSWLSGETEKLLKPVKVKRHLRQWNRIFLCHSKGLLY